VRKIPRGLLPLAFSAGLLPISVYGGETCGIKGLPCCTNQSCAETDAICLDGVCHQCGYEGDPPCSTGACRGWAVEDPTGHCVRCGDAAGFRCCPPGVGPAMCRSDGMFIIACDPAFDTCQTCQSFVQCVIDEALSPVCPGIPTGVAKKLTKGLDLVSKATGSSGEKQARQLKHSRAVLVKMRTKAAKAATRGKISSECAAALSSVNISDIGGVCGGYVNQPPLCAPPLVCGRNGDCHFGGCLCEQP
jgi:hypothetical protein